MHRYGTRVSSVTVVTSIIVMLNYFVWNPLPIYVGESLTIHAACCSSYACLHNTCACTSHFVAVLEHEWQ